MLPAARPKEDKTQGYIFLASGGYPPRVHPFNLASNKSRRVRAWCAGGLREKGSKMSDTDTILKAVLTANEDRRARALQILETGIAEAPPEPLLTPRQLCERLRISRATLWRWRLPGIRRGGVLRYRWPEVLAALEASKPAPAKRA